MKKTILLLLIGCSVNLMAAGPYKLFADYTDYVELVNADTLNSDLVWNESSAFALDLGFDFKIGDNSYSSVNVKAGGIQFVGFGQRELYVFTVPFGGYLLKDRGIETSISPIVYKVEGEEGSRIMKIQWKNAGFAQWFTSSDPEDFVNFQIWLFESDNSVEIQFGPSQTDPGTYGHPEAMSQTGPFPIFNYTSDSALQIYGNADNPSYNFAEFPFWADLAIDGTPSNGTLYIIQPNSQSNGGQDSFCSYNFKKENSEYQELANSINITNNDTWNKNSVYTVNLDFQFVLNNQSYSKVNVYAGGGISFSGLEEKALRVFFTPFGGYLLKCRNDDFLTSGIKYELTGENNNHIFKIQWENAGFVQWYETSSPNDYIDFQIWLYESNGKIEIHFGNSSTNPGTYGYPEATSDANPGPSVQLAHYNCEKVLCVISYANNPSFDYLNICSPNYSFIDGTPDNDIVYQFIPEEPIVGINRSESDEIRLFPNPAKDLINIESVEQIELIEIFDINGNLVYRKPENQNYSTVVDIGRFVSGNYLMRLTYNNITISKLFMKH